MEKKERKNSQKILKTYDRALRNYSYSGVLWGNYIRALITFDTETTRDYDALRDKALIAGLPAEENEYLAVFEAHLDATLRIAGVVNVVHEKDKKQDAMETENTNISEETKERVRAVFTYASDYMNQYFPGGAMRIDTLWGIIESEKFNDIKETRKIYDRILTVNPKDGSQYILWSQVEKRIGKIDKARSLFKRACHSMPENAPSVWTQWIAFERCYGTMSDVQHAEEKVATAKVKYASIQKKQQYGTRRPKKEQPKKNIKKKEPKKRDNKKKDAGQSNAKKRARDEGNVNEEPPQKRQKREDTQGGDEDDERNKKAAAKEARMKTKREKDQRTVVINNVQEEDTVESITELMTQFGVIEEVRLVQRRNMGFVQFQEKASATQAAVVHVVKIGERRIPIRKIHEGKVTAEADSLYKHYDDDLVLFVANLNFKTEKTTLAKAFCEVVEPVDVRLMLKPGGASRGFAYVEFGSKEDLDKGLRMNGRKVDGRSIVVKRCDPSRAKKRVAPQAENRTRNEPRKNRKPDPPMIPRSMRQKMRFVKPKAVAQKKDTINRTDATKSSSNTKKDETMTDASSSGGMSNDDFKKFLQ